MADPRFPYRTIIDRVITDEKGNILFGENPANIYDNINDENQKQMITKLQTQINNQNSMITKMNNQITNQETQIEHLSNALEKADTQIANQETAIMRLQTIIDEEEKQTANQVTQIGHQTTQITNQESIIAKLSETFDVVVNGNTMEIYGSSNDTKPTDGIKVGTTFYEYDTNEVYMWTSSSWVLI